jgi:hypothetical protein
MLLRLNASDRLIPLWLRSKRERGSRIQRSKRKREVASPVVRVAASLRQGAAQREVVSVVPMAPKACGKVDGVQDIKANLKAWTASSIASSSCREERLETRRVEVNFGRPLVHRFAAG